MKSPAWPAGSVSVQPGPENLIRKARNPFWLAPMAGITDLCFRQLMDQLGAGVLISELVSAKGLLHGSEKTHRMIRMHPQRGTLVGIQLFGESAEDLIEAGHVVARAGADFIDINLGCPVKKVVKKGCGAALMRDPVYLESYLTRIRKGVPLPLTVKMRTGWSDQELTIHECVQAAEQAGCEWVAVHGRTRAQGYEGKADWNLIREVRRRARIPIIGNGDLRDPMRAHLRLEETGVDAVMIGRGALRNPWIFRECTGGQGEGPLGRFHLLAGYHQLLREQSDARQTLILLRKMAVWLAYGFTGAAGFRGGIFKLPTASAVLDHAGEFFQSVAHLPPPRFEETEAFMMGGHG
ncbi:MAG: transcriptional regulator [Nitrospinae bacterium CG11_big_fil_rev_8_21_14_0_20_56_8]|nr:MAG: transcriptional regulator [Nitrospinae bacterium CG11_big_fil_rev_8_21_14_0_20_56_8]